MVINEVTILVWIVCGIGSFLIAQNRGASNAPTWFLVGVLLGPLGILLAAIGAKGPGGSGTAAIGAADELSKLAALRDNGTISGEEFDRQKAGLLRAAPQVTVRDPAKMRVIYVIVGILVVMLVWLLIQIR